MTLYFGPENILLTMNVRVEQTIDAIEAAVRNRFPEVRHIFLEAESLHANDRIDDPAFPNAADAPPTPR
jgi:hypothetical protein